MTVSLRHISASVVYLWVAALFYEAFTAPPRLIVFGMLVEAERSRTVVLLVGVTIACCAAIIISNRSSYIAGIIKYSTPNILLFILSFFLIGLGILQNSPSGVAYAILLCLTLILTLYINHSLSNSFYFSISVLLACSLLVFLIYYGFPNNRWIGGIHPNHTGAFCVSTAYFAARSRNRYRWLLYAIAAFFAIVVSSRYAIIAIFIIGIFDYFTLIKLSLSRLFMTVFLAFIGFIFVVTVSDYILIDVLRLDDPNRGLGSGMTGRTDMMGNFWGQFVKHPLIGYGFRNRDEYITTHNGFLNFALENGFFATCILAAVVYSGIYRSIRNFRTSRDSLQLMRFGFWSAWLTAGFFQPQIVNFGDAFALFTFFLLTDNRLESATSRSPPCQPI
ncbi:MULTISPECIES: O-antigen ligase family protein [unclassified Thiocapsa]|uniref:O-antigen ligase family protein n=1 Tax=unclassified Thiocapsa TaxID=2641286 RepID=UPI0035B34117